MTGTVLFLLVFWAVPIAATAIGIALIVGVSVARWLKEHWLLIVALILDYAVRKL